MRSAIEIANKFVQIAEKENSLFTNMKLQKLIYIANGINLALNNEPLIIEHVEVWPYGPVVSSVYHSYKYFGDSNICFGTFGIFPLYVDLNEEEKKSFDDAWKITKGIDGIKLSNWTHNPGSPWSRAREGNLPYIPDDYMKEFFTGFLNK